MNAVKLNRKAAALRLALASEASFYTHDYPFDDDTEADGPRRTA